MITTSVGESRKSPAVVDDQAFTWDGPTVPEELVRIRQHLESAIVPLAEGISTRDGMAAPRIAADDAIDGVTRLPNHRSFRETLDRSRRACRLRQEPIAMLLADLDGFSRFNDAHSHRVGDVLLRWIGGAMRRCCRPTDFVARYDWDQFAAFLPGCSEADAVEIAERCRAHWLKRPPWLSLLPSAIKVSVGVAGLAAGFVEGDQTLIRMANAALAVAKQLGGDQTLAWSRIATQDFDSAACAGRSGTAPGVSWSSYAQDRVRQTGSESIRALVAAVEAKDSYTRDHSLRASHYAEGLATRLGLPSEEVDSLRTAGILHDVGKIGVPDYILCKPGPLTLDEYAAVKRHPAIAVEILGHASYFRAELPIILHHHEWFDGSGYPAAIAGEAIPFGARVLSVADCIDAMLSPRSYKDGYSTDRVRKELLDYRGRQFDPQVAAVAAEWMATSPGDFARGERGQVPGR